MATSVAVSVLHTPDSAVQGATAIHYRPLQPQDFPEIKAAHAALFPIDYEDNFFHRATNGLDRIWSCAAVSTDPYSKERMIGFITAKSVFLHEVDASDRQHMGLLSAVLDHDRVLYIMTLGVVEGHRHRGIASTLISIACQHAYEARCRAVFLHVITYNAAAMSLYSRQGFSCVAKLAAFYWITTGRTPDPHQQVYDAYLFVQYVGGAAGVPSPWDLVSLAWSPLRLAFNRIHACMPGFCSRLEQPQQQQQLQLQLQQQQQLLPGAPDAQHWDDISCGSAHSSTTAHVHAQHSTCQAQQQLRQPAQQQWHSDVSWQPTGGQHRHRGPSLTGRQRLQQPLQQQYQQLPKVSPQQPQLLHLHQGPQCWGAYDPGAVAPDQQQYMLHQTMHPPQQRMLRWLFNGASRGSSGVQEQQSLHQHQQHQQHYAAASGVQHWHRPASEQHKQG